MIERADHAVVAAASTAAAAVLGAVTVVDEDRGAARARARAEVARYLPVVAQLAHPGWSSGRPTASRHGSVSLLGERVLPRFRMA